MNRGKQIATVALVFVAVVLVGTASVALVSHRGPFAETRATASEAPLTAEPVDLGPVIATVNGAPVYLGEAKSRVDGIAVLHGDVESVLGEEWHTVILGSLVSDQVLRAEAEAREIEISDSDIASAVAEVQGMIGQDQTFEGWLAAQDITYGEFLRRVEFQLIAARVYEAITEDVVVTGKEIRGYYRSHEIEFTGTDGHVSSLLEVRGSIREGLLKDRQDTAYAEWLEAAKAAAEVEIVMQDWWRDLV